MKETQLLGTLLPSHPDFIPIIQAIRENTSYPKSARRESTGQPSNTTGSSFTEMARTH